MGNAGLEGLEGFRWDGRDGDESGRERAQAAAEWGSCGATAMRSCRRFAAAFILAAEEARELRLKEEG